MSLCGLAEGDPPLGGGSPARCLCTGKCPARATAAAWVPAPARHAVPAVTHPRVTALPERPVRPPRAGTSCRRERSPSWSYVLASLRALHLDGDLPRQESAPSGRTPGGCGPNRLSWRASFKHPLEPGEIGGHCIRVGPKVLIAHTRASAQREHHLTAVSARDHPHRVINDFTRGQRDVVIENAIFIALSKGEANTPSEVSANHCSSTFSTELPSPGAHCGKLAGSEA